MGRPNFCPKIVQSLPLVFFPYSLPSSLLMSLRDARTIQGSVTGSGLFYCNRLFPSPLACILVLSLLESFGDEPSFFLLHPPFHLSFFSYIDSLFHFTRVPLSLQSHKFRHYEFSNVTAPVVFPPFPPFFPGATFSSFKDFLSLLVCITEDFRVLGPLILDLVVGCGILSFLFRSSLRVWFFFFFSLGVSLYE